MEITLACVVGLILLILGWSILVTLNVFAQPSFSQFWLLSHGDANALAYALMIFCVAAITVTAYYWKYKLKQTIDVKTITWVTLISIFIVAILWSIGVSADYFAQPCFSQFWVLNRETADLWAYFTLLYSSTAVILSIWYFSIVATRKTKQP